MLNYLRFCSLKQNFHVILFHVIEYLNLHFHQKQYYKGFFFYIYIYDRNSNLNSHTRIFEDLGDWTQILIEEWDFLGREIITGLNTQMTINNK